MIQCACGCGIEFSPSKKNETGLMRGHHWKTKHVDRTGELCFCGCGYPLPPTRHGGNDRRRFIRGHANYVTKAGAPKWQNGMAPKNLATTDYNWDNLETDLQLHGSARSLCRVTGLSRHVVYDKAERLNLRHLLVNNGESRRVGRLGELMALSILPGSVDNCYTGIEPFDIRWLAKKVNVKTSRPRYTRQSSSLPFWSFNGSGRATCDAFLCMGLDDNEDLCVGWLIPREVFPVSVWTTTIGMPAKFDLDHRIFTNTFPKTLP